MLRRRKRPYIENVTDKDFPPKTGIFFCHTGNDDYEECIVKMDESDYTVLTLDGRLHDLSSFNTISKKWVEASNPNKLLGKKGIDEDDVKIINNIQMLSIPGTYFMRSRANIDFSECLIFEDSEGIKVARVEGETESLDEMDLKTTEWVKSQIPNKAPKRKEVRRPNKKGSKKKDTTQTENFSIMTNDTEHQRQIHEFLQSKGNVAISDEDLNLNDNGNRRGRRGFNR